MANINEVLVSGWDHGDDPITSAKITDVRRVTRDRGDGPELATITVQVELTLSGVINPVPISLTANVNRDTVLVNLP